MLVSFSVSNFRSFGEEVTLNLVATKRLTDHPEHCISIPQTGERLLRAAVLYGANAAGKSNLVKAMKFVQQMIVGQDDQTATAQPFSFDPSSSGKPSSFELRFLVDDRIFIYGFDVNKEGIESEWLSAYNHGDETEIFVRDAAGGATVGANAKKLTDPDTASALVKLRALPFTKDQLFLNRAFSVPETSLGPTLSAIIHWLTNGLVIFDPQPKITDLLDRIHGDHEFRNFCTLFLNHIGTGITDLRILENERPPTEWDRMWLRRSRKGVGQLVKLAQASSEHSDSRIDPANPAKVFTRTLVSQHLRAGPESLLPFYEESDGTRQLLHLMTVIFPSPEQSKVFVIDELDRSLHPLICWEFIRFFSNTFAGLRKQLIVTTHEAHLLDQDLLRRDEYWFVEKNKEQQSRLTSLSDFNIRRDLQTEKGYLQGRFGAIPMIGGMDALERLLECRKKEGADDASKEAKT